MAEEKKTYEDMSNPEKIDAKKRKIKGKNRETLCKIEKRC